MHPPEDEARYPTWMAHSTVPRHPWRSAEASELLASNQPVVLTDCPLIATLAGRWEFATLSDLCGTHELGVHTTPAGTQTFARHYGRGLGVGTIRPMTFATFADACAAHLAAQSSSGSDSGESYYLQAPLRWTDEHGEPRAAAMPALQAELEAVDWDWLDHVCGTTGSRPFGACQLWAGHGGGSTPCHFDAQDNFLAQLVGRKQCLLLPPSEAFGLYPYPVGHPKDNFAVPDLEEEAAAAGGGEAVLRRFPALRRVRGAEATLQPGDVLYLPKCAAPAPPTRPAAPHPTLLSARALRRSTTRRAVAE